MKKKRKTDPCPGKGPESLYQAPDKSNSFQINILLSDCYETLDVV